MDAASAQKMHLKCPKVHGCNNSQPKTDWTLSALWQLTNLFDLLCLPQLTKMKKKHIIVKLGWLIKCILTRQCMRFWYTRKRHNAHKIIITWMKRERSTCWSDTPGGSLSCLKSSRSLMHAFKRSCGEAKSRMGLCCGKTMETSHYNTLLHRR